MKKKWKKSLSFRENLQKRLPMLASEYFAAARAAMAPGTSWQDMHQFRLTTKRFRYTLEIFRPAYGPGLEQRIEALKKVQTFLGDINDCIISSGMLEALPATDDIRNELADKADKKTQKLRSFWRREFDAEGRQLSWERYLRNYACRTKPAPRRALETNQASEPAAALNAGAGPASETAD